MSQQQLSGANTEEEFEEKYKWKDLRNTKAEMSEIQMLRHAVDNGGEDKN